MEIKGGNKMIPSSEREHYWNQIKENRNVLSTEEIFEFNPQPEAQCPKVDSIIKEIVGIHRESSVSKNDELDDLVYKLESINSDTYSLDSDVEELRTAIVELREWGNQWKDLAKKLIQDYSINLDDI